MTATPATTAPPSTPAAHMARHGDLGALERQLRALDTAVPVERLDAARMRAAARQLVASGKGVLAADESASTADKRLAAAGAAVGLEGRRAYRQVLLDPDGLGDHISGVILYDETIRQHTDDGTPFPVVLANRGVLAGAKVDTGTAPLAGAPEETMTKGLDGLRTRLAEYVELGIGFAKWRATFTVEAGPTPACLNVNVVAMAAYAALCQEFGVVPMVEPELLMDGAHGLADAEATTTTILHALFDAMFTQGVDLSASLLKVNMVVPGNDSIETPTHGEVAAATLRALRRTVPPSVAGVVFLSGGQSARAATARLDAINRATRDAVVPWPLSFSFARAIQEPVLTAWAGQDDNVEAARAALRRRAACNGAAATGAYTAAMDESATPAGAA